MNHRLSQQSSYQIRLAIGTGIMVVLALALTICLLLIPVPSDELSLSFTSWRGVQSVYFGNVKVCGEEAGNGGASKTSLFLPAVAIVTDSVPHAQEFGGGKVAGKRGNLTPQSQAALIERLSALSDGLLPPIKPARDLCFESHIQGDRHIIQCRPIIYLPDALYWLYSEAPPDTIVVGGVIIQGPCGWSFVLNSVTPDEPRVRAAVVKTFQRHLFIVGKGEVYQRFQSVFIKGQRYSKVWYVVKTVEEP